MQSYNREMTYNILWEFWVKAGSESEFEKHYGSNGTWAQLFRRGKGYIGTNLFGDVSNPQRYLTLDQWNSQEEFEIFEKEYGKEYKAIDNTCEQLTTKEVRLSSWDSG
jgi:heme-degrading monooxygenase HmoA